MFVSCGYNTPDVIAEMDVNQSAEMNDIDKILDYVMKTFPQDQRRMKENEVELYDSLQLSPTLQTQIVITKYLRSQSSSIKMKVVNVAVQKGSTDCGLYAIAMMTSIAYKEDPTHVVYNQQDLRLHLKQCFDKGILTKFPVSQKR